MKSPKIHSQNILSKLQPKTMHNAPILLVADRTLLSRTWFPVCFFSICVFIFLQALLRYDQLHSSSPICYNPSYKMGYWVWLSFCFSAVSFLVKCILLIIHWWIAGRASIGTAIDLIGISGTNLTITLIAGSSNLLTAVFDWGGTCIDKFNVATPATQYVEWITCVPLLVYYIIAVEFKEEFTRRDIYCILSMTFSMIFNAILQQKISQTSSIVVMIFIHMFYFIFIFLFNNVQLPGCSLRIQTFIQKFLLEGDIHNSTHIRNLNVQQQLSSILTYTMPAYVITYYLAWAGWIDHDMTMFLFIISNILTKLIFSSVALFYYTNMLFNSYIEQIRVNEARQAHLRYIMHEVRVPLSSISMGIDALATIDEDDDDDDDVGYDVTDEEAGCTGMKTGKFGDHEDLDQLRLSSRHVDSHRNSGHSSSESSGEKEHLLRGEKGGMSISSPSSIRLSSPDKRMVRKSERSLSRRRSLLSPEAQETLSMMREATAFMGDTLNSVLNMQKIEQGRLELNFKPFDVNHVVAKVTQTLFGPMTLKDILLTVFVHPNIPTLLLGDQFQIEHVLANLLSNAIKFSSIGGKIDILVTILYETDLHYPNVADTSKSSKMISTFSKPTSPMAMRQSQHAANKVMDDHLYIKFSVTDYGVGISPEDQSLLFQPFSQIRPGELQQGGGSGIGLSICKQIIELHGGYISVTSAANQGSTFFFVLPLVISQATASIPSPLNSPANPIGKDGSETKPDNVTILSTPSRDHNHNSSAISLFNRMNVTTNSNQVNNNSNTTNIHNTNNIKHELRGQKPSPTSPKKEFLSSSFFKEPIKRLSVGMNLDQLQLDYDMIDEVVDEEYHNHDPHNNHHHRHRHNGVQGADHTHHFSNSSDRISGSVSMSGSDPRSTFSVSDYHDQADLKRQPSTGVSIREKESKNTDSWRNIGSGLMKSRLERSRESLVDSSASGPCLEIPSLSVKSESKQMTASLPSHLTDTDTAAAAATGAAGAATGVVAGRSIHQIIKHVLVADDVPSNRKLLIMLISRRKIQCFESCDGADSIKMVTDKPDFYDLIFMDNLMPNMNGVDATRSLRAAGFTKLIIGLTGNALDEDIAQFCGAGADMVFSKPLRLEQLNMLFQYILIYGNESPFLHGKRLDVTTGQMVPLAV